MRKWKSGGTASDSKERRRGAAEVGGRGLVSCLSPLIFSPFLNQALSKPKGGRRISCGGRHRGQRPLSGLLPKKAAD